MKCIQEYLEYTARRFPDKVALRDESTALTFRELEGLAQAGGSALLNHGLQKEPVAVFLPKAPKTIACFLAVAYAGCCYVPLDTGMPLFRLRAILKQIQPRVILCDTASAAIASELGFGAAVISAEEVLSHAVDEAALTAVRERASAEDPLYIVFTSGSTGEPKGVQACHRTVIAYAESLCSTIGFTEDTVFAMQVPLMVDACLKELLGCLRCGAEVVLMPQKLFLMPLAAVEFLNRFRINTLCWVSSALSMLSGLDAFAECRPEHLHTVCFGSEVFPPKQLRLWQEAAPGARFFNLYGPTECTGMSFCYPVSRSFGDSEPIPIGKPLPGTDFLLLREDNTPADPGEPGEICIGGDGVTMGYFHNPELTAAVFTPNPFAPEEVIYRTGDLGRLNADGELLFLSRKDAQIKNMGYRVEPGEIEACACCCEGVSTACCVWNPEKKKLYLFYIGTAEERLLRELLRRELPRYMHPAAVTRLETLPLLPNGKPDRKSLLAQTAGRGNHGRTT